MSRLHFGKHSMTPGVRPSMLTSVALGAAVLGLAGCRSSPTAADSPKGTPTVTTHARGPFDVKLTPQPFDGQPDSSGSPPLGRMQIDKQFHGDLEATSIGQMLAAGTTTRGSAGYVAIERVTGTLHGMTGSFVLQHTGTMNRGTPALGVTVVPDSGTGQLVGLSGSMQIIIADGKHSYDFEYTLPETAR